ncbi:hypothetical protein ABMA27_016758 [Loxostege sticticalis]|uniref:PHD-type domain-containing protein n=1 Tax=Loxostege sticticalis TaxID=481309 RepID=A0ABR3I3F3_LOXSC
MNCQACHNKVESREVLSCKACKGNYHYVCLNIPALTYGANLNDFRGKWRCPSCANITRRNRGDETPTRNYSESLLDDANMSCDDLCPEQPIQTNPTQAHAGASTNPDPNILDILREIRALRNEFSSMKEDLRQATTGIRSLNERFCEMESRFSAIEDRLTANESKMSLVTKLQVNLDAAKETISTLQYENNKNNQFSRINNVEISGVPLSSGENLVTIIQTICSKVGTPFDERDVDTIQRVRRFEMNDGNNRSSTSRPPAIVVKFVRRMCKDKLLAAVRTRRGLTTADIGISGPSSNIYVSDHLTPQNKLLLRRAREMKSELQYSYLWIRDCKILMRKNDHSKVILIANESDLSKLK